MDIENPGALLAYLRDRTIISESDNPEFRRLEGGVSNRTVLVHSSSCRPFVVKQALPKLRVAVDWYSDPARIHNEALGLKWLEKLAPAGTITPLLFEDPEQHIVGMSAVPEPHQNWKTLLLNGDLCFRHIEQFAILLGTIHLKSFEQRDTIARVFADRTFFETLRIEPYYRFSAEQVPEASHFLEELIEDTLRCRLALVHGDFSPKNILVYQDRLVLLDHEVIHFGDPAFDVGFSLTHLLSKAHHVRHRRAEFLNAAHVYARRYLDCIRSFKWCHEVESRAVRHTLACLLARAVGRSPLEYLTPAERNAQCSITRALITRVASNVPELIDVFSEKLRAFD